MLALVFLLLLPLQFPISTELIFENHCHAVFHDKAHFLVMIERNAQECGFF